MHMHAVTAFVPLTVLTHRVRRFTAWLQEKFGMTHFESAVITRKAEETFRDPQKPLAPLADEWLKTAKDEAKDKR